MVTVMTVNRREVLFAITAGMALDRRVRSGENGGLPMAATANEQVFELRQYTLRRGQRDTLISLFEKNYLDPQNELGAHVIGTFRDWDDPDRFVWIRGFRDMDSRLKALSSFYD